MFGSHDGISYIARYFLMDGRVTSSYFQIQFHCIVTFVSVTGNWGMNNLPFMLSMNYIDTAGPTYSVAGHTIHNNLSYSKRWRELRETSLCHYHYQWFLYPNSRLELLCHSYIDFKIQMEQQTFRLIKSFFYNFDCLQWTSRILWWGFLLWTACE